MPCVYCESDWLVSNVLIGNKFKSNMARISTLLEKRHGAVTTFMPRKACGMNRSRISAASSAHARKCLVEPDRPTRSYSKGQSMSLNVRQTCFVNALNVI